MESPHLLEAIDVHLDRLKAAAVRAGPDAPVPGCPKWTVRDLVAHLVTVHSFTVAGITGEPEEPQPPASDWDDLLGCWDGRRLAAREALSGPPETTTPSPFGRGEVTRAIWIRRMAHEAAIHRLDAETVLGWETPFSPAFAADGVDEYLSLLMPNIRVSPDAATAHFHATDTGHAWTVRLAPGEPPRTEQTASGTPDVTVTGPAAQLYRAVWGRPAATETSGAAGLLRPLAAP